MLTERFVKQGMNAEDARYAARRQFGALTQIQEQIRERRSVPLFDELRQDAKLALRQLRKAPRFTAIAVSVLALGAGANTAMFSVIDGVLLRSLPYPQAEQLVWVGEVLKGNTADEVTLTPNFLDWRRQNHVFTAMAAFNYRPRTLMEGEAIQLRTVKASAALLPILKVQPLIGRSFLTSEDQKGHDQVAILSYGLWQQSFGGAKEIVGRTITLDDGTYDVVGILPPDFHFPGQQPIDLMTPLGKNEELELTRGDGTTTIVRDVVARLKPGVTLEQARAEMEIIESRLAPPAFFKGGQMTVRVLSLHDRFVGNIRPALLAILWAVGFLLLMACANVANLLLSRAVSRQREFAIRAALGASRRRIAQQLLVESLVLAALSCVSGVLLAFWMRSLLAVPETIPGFTTLPLDFRVLGFAVAIACASAVAFGLGPSLAGASAAISPALVSDGRSLSLGGHRRFWLNLLASAQMAIAIVLLTGGGLMLQSFWKLRYHDLGFVTDRLLTARLNLSGVRYANPAKQIAFLDALLDDIRSLPGVEGIAAGNLPPGDGHATNGFGIEGRALAPQGRRPVARQYSVSPEYFRLLGIPLLQGRGIVDSDNADALPVALISQTFARINFAGENPIGKRIRSERNDPWRTIAGVVGDVKTAGMASAPEPVIYFPYRQTGAMGGDAGILIRTAFDPASIGPELRKRISQIDRQQPVVDIQTMDHRLTESVAKPRLAAVFLGSFAALGLLLAAVGIYGVMSFLVRWRFREIGIRLAVGARPRDVTRMILTHSLKLILAGVAAGVCCALYLGRLIQKLLYGVSSTDPLTFGLAIGFLVLIGLAASYLPARQASQIDPMATLRSE